MTEDQDKQWECATAGCYRKPGACGHCAEHCTEQEFPLPHTTTTKDGN